ncbi:glycoside hydrolase family 15 protein [Moheibacter sediminis]|uniref:Glucoamylase (Glucan-1,4-alpha-glucosidase), GH15 family n=1 Tax=Moheibacter sediminis TaxID=1434700 RepID=A0A1W1Y8V7_9FLAO|nr:glycoside hydrolase family 15 protein [Moheibacter sediminis]SMC32576.1 Glucoamylase (glucan-1,4-alpha-glucosidase), GH15 family [Moheibacter sediminis]
MDNLNYGIIGNCLTAALISKNGSIDWCCLPKFDSPSIFAKLLDEEKGGSFGFEVDDSYKISQKYLPKTNILVTHFESFDAAFEVRDFMPRYYDDNGKLNTPLVIIRYLVPLKGIPKFKVKYNPKIGYAKEETISRIKDGYIKSHTLEGMYDSVYMYSNFDYDSILNEEEITLTEDSYLLMSYYEKILDQSIERAFLQYQRTYAYWLNWSEKTTNYKLYNKEIRRSALVLKLLTYEKSGAVLAAATTSLPETIGEVRNWDYRFCWIRDASMALKVLFELGHVDSAQRFMNFITSTVANKGDKMQIMYGINSETILTENTLEHLSGYENSTPVRVGNAAYIQKQNDIFGILIEIIYKQFLYFKNSLEHSEELWMIVSQSVHVVEENWMKPDKGIWEHRAEDRHFTFSKLLCWVAVDRAIKIAELIHKTSMMEQWTELRDNIYNDIYENAWNPDVEAYTQSYGSPDLDASILLMEEYDFIKASDPRYISTVQAIEKELLRDGLMYRYKNRDDFGLPSSSFTICSFWFINSLYKIGEKKKAIQYFDQILSYSNHLGLFSEDIDFETKRLLGNFPQAYSHLALIQTAINISGGISEQEELKNL